MTARESNVAGAERRRALAGWNPALVQHELDRRATEALGSIPGIELVAAKFLEYGAARQEAVALLGSGLRVSDRQLRPLYRLYRETAEVLEVDAPPKLYLEQGGFNAYTFEAHERYVVLQTDLVRALTEAELRYVLGHELGHVLFGHVRYSLMAAQIRVVLELISQATLGIGAWAGKGLEVALLEWGRKAELSCDRVGVLAVQDDGIAAMSALMKMAGAPRGSDAELDLAAFLEQAEEFDALGLDVGGLYKLLATVPRSHPWCVARASELRKWIRADGPALAAEGKPCPAYASGRPALAASAEDVRVCPRCGTERAPNSSTCWKRGCGDATPLGECPRG